MVADAIQSFPAASRPSPQPLTSALDLIDAEQQHQHQRSINSDRPSSTTESKPTPQQSPPKPFTSNQALNMPTAKPVVVTRSGELKTSGGQTEGMIRQNALADLTDGICASRMIARPHTASAVHHHEDQDTVVFAFSQFPVPLCPPPSLLLSLDGLMGGHS